MQYQKERTLECFVWWLDEPLANLPGFIHVGVTTGPKKADPAPLLVHGYWWSSGWSPVSPCPQDDGVTLQLDAHPWQVRGIHEGNGTPARVQPGSGAELLRAAGQGPAALGGNQVWRGPGPGVRLLRRLGVALPGNLRRHLRGV